MKVSTQNMNSNGIHSTKILPVFFLKKHNTTFYNKFYISTYENFNSKYKIICISCAKNIAGNFYGIVGDHIIFKYIRNTRLHILSQIF